MTVAVASALGKRFLHGKVAERRLNPFAGENFNRRSAANAVFALQPRLESRGYLRIVDPRLYKNGDAPALPGM